MKNLCIVFDDKFTNVKLFIEKTFEMCYFIINRVRCHEPASSRTDGRQLDELLHKGMR